jgi:drug/metabolite transporter (DMT)-like permease
MPRAERSSPETGRRRTAVGALLVAVAIWGGSFVVIRSGVRSVGLFDFLALRFFFAAVVLSALAARHGELRRALTQPWPWVLGALLFAAVTLQAAGLKTTSPAHSAFVTSLSVLVVPFLVWASARTPPSRRNWIAAALATAGLVLIFSGSTGHWQSGDVLTLLCAVAFAVYVVVAGKVTAGVSVIGCVAVQSLLCLALSLPCLAFERGALLAGSGHSEVLWSAAYAGIAATALAYGLQLFAQRHVGPIQTAILLSLEPVTATAASLLLGDDRLTAALVLGGCLLLVAAISVGGPPGAGRWENCDTDH